MWKFIISGYIPGTNVQFGYNEFLIAYSLGACAYLAWLLIKEKRALQQLLLQGVLGQKI